MSTSESPGRTVLVWFRRDLRLRDNPALRAALDEADHVIPVYLYRPSEAEPWSEGGASRWWLHHSLGALEASLRERGSRLVLRSGDSSLELLRALIQETGADGVFWNRLYDPQLMARDREVERALAGDGLEVGSFKGTVLAEPWEVSSKAGDPMKVYSPFYKAFRRQVTVDEPIALARVYRAPESWPQSEPLSDWGLVPEPDWADGFSQHWSPGEEGALETLDRFVESRLEGYKDARDRPADCGVSCLSPHLHFGEISPRWVWHRIQGYLAEHPAADRGGEHFLKELGWREFAHHILFNFPHTPDRPMYEKYAAFPWRDADDYAEDLSAWQRGRTGIPIVDAGMRELWATGYMHNRVRMIVASLLVKNLLIPWREGARWFWDTLVDADLANNTMGWQWSAGSGADAAPYFRIFNPVTQGQRFDAEGRYVRRWVPELGELPDHYIHAPWELPDEAARRIGFRLGRDYPVPIVELKGSRQRALDALKTLKEQGV